MDRRKKTLSESGEQQTDRQIEMIARERERTERRLELLCGRTAIIIFWSEPISPKECVMFPSRMIADNIREID
jgi:hypothetical protein